MGKNCHICSLPSNHLANNMRPTFHAPTVTCQTVCVRHLIIIRHVHSNKSFYIIFKKVITSKLVKRQLINLSYRFVDFIGLYIIQTSEQLNPKGFLILFSPCDRIGSSANLHSIPLNIITLNRHGRTDYTSFSSLATSNIHLHVTVLSRLGIIK